MIKNIPQSPFNQSTKAPDDAAKVVRPAVPMDAHAYRELHKIYKIYHNPPE